MWVRSGAARRFLREMACHHDGFHDIHTAYDRRREVLVFHWTCERCGAKLKEAAREKYRPAFDPEGNRRFFAPSTS
jgi:hypothetical protein